MIYCSWTVLNFHLFVLLVYLLLNMNKKNKKFTLKEQIFLFSCRHDGVSILWRLPATFRLIWTSRFLKSILCCFSFNFCYFCNFLLKFDSSKSFFLLFSLHFYHFFSSQMRFNSSKTIFHSVYIFFNLHLRVVYYSVAASSKGKFCKFLICFN